MTKQWSDAEIDKWRRIAFALGTGEDVAYQIVTQLLRERDDALRELDERDPYHEQLSETQVALGMRCGDTGKLGCTDTLFEVADEARKVVAERDRWRLLAGASGDYLPEPTLDRAMQRRAFERVLAEGLDIAKAEEDADAAFEAWLEERG